jgi:DNA-binding IclR family transcriptional regulator
MSADGLSHGRWTSARSSEKDSPCIGNAELARRLGLSVSTTHRYVSTLVALGLAERAPKSRKYRRAALS